MAAHCFNSSQQIFSVFELQFTSTSNKFLILDTLNLLFVHLWIIVWYLSLMTGSLNFYLCISVYNIYECLWYLGDVISLDLVESYNSIELLKLWRWWPGVSDVWCWCSQAARPGPTKQLCGLQRKAETWAGTGSQESRAANKHSRILKFYNHRPY